LQIISRTFLREQFYDGKLSEYTRQTAKDRCAANPKWLLPSTHRNTHGLAIRMALTVQHRTTNIRARKN
jgi:hypothetical protein